MYKQHFKVGTGTLAIISCMLATLFGVFYKMGDEKKRDDDITYTGSATDVKNKWFFPTIVAFVFFIMFLLITI